MSQAKPSPEQIERELAALGEAPPSEAELELARAQGPADEAPELATVVRLVELAEPLAFDDLSELESHRVWRQIEQRLGPSGGQSGGGAIAAGEDAGASGSAGAANGEASVSPRPVGGGPRRWLSAAVGLAAAAAVVLVVVTSEQERGELEAPSAEQVAELGEQVRASLRVLDDGKSDSERATERAAEYRRRLAAREERGG